MPAPLTVVMVVPSLSSGGAERVVQLVSGGLAARGHHVTVVTTTSRPDFHELDPGVDRRRVDATGAPPGTAASRTGLGTALAHTPGGLLRLRRTIHRCGPDVVVGFLEHANLMALALTRRDVPVVVTEHADPTGLPAGGVCQFLRRRLYPTAASVVSVSEGIDAQLAFVPPERRAVIANPVRAVEPDPATPTPCPGPYLAAMGRLVHAKGFDLLVEAFARLHPRHDDVGLAIIGEGPALDALSAQVSALGLASRVHFVGARRDPFGLVARASAFVLPSRTEGFGNALVEALALGVPSIAFDCPTGPATIVRHGDNGLLVPAGDVEALARAIELVLGDDELRDGLAARAPASVERFAIDRIVDQWEALLAGIVGSRRPGHAGLRR